MATWWLLYGSLFRNDQSASDDAEATVKGLDLDVSQSVTLLSKMSGKVLLVNMEIIQVLNELLVARYTG